MELTAEHKKKVKKIVAKADKPKILIRMFEHGDMARTLVFTRTKYGADRLVRILKKAGIQVAFRGQNKRNPIAPGQLSDWYFIENVNHHVKRKIVKDVNASPKWRNGVSPAKRSASQDPESTGLHCSVRQCAVRQ